MTKINPCLWFNDQGEDAAKLYTSLFPNSKITLVTHYGEGSGKATGQKNGSAMTVEFQLEDLPILALNGGPHLKHTPALSLFVTRKTEKEVDALWKKLSEGGEVRMGLDKYPWAQKYGWTSDRFGIDWQIMLSDGPQKIAPAFLFVREMFGKGEEALGFYMSQFENSKLHAKAMDESTKTIMHAAFNIGGIECVLMEGQGTHEFGFSPAFSFVVNCETQSEIDSYWKKLSEGGALSQCGWLSDKFGVSWQIVPAQLGEWMRDGKKTEAIMTEVMKMQKLDLETMKRAAGRA